MSVKKTVKKNAPVKSKRASAAASSKNKKLNVSDKDKKINVKTKSGKGIIVDYGVNKEFKDFVRENEKIPTCHICKWRLNCDAIELAGLDENADLLDDSSWEYYCGFWTFSKKAEKVLPFVKRIIKK